MQGNMSSRKASGFTLVELLVVIAIIAVLVGILLPAFNTVRTKAREASTHAQFTALATGIESFRAETALGGYYPPSNGDAQTMPTLPPHIANPREMQIPGPGAMPPMPVTGAHLLVHAMVGADLQGPPGFRDMDNDGVWADDTHRGMNGTYQRNATTGQPVTPRYGGGGYVDDKMRARITTLEELKQRGIYDNWVAFNTPEMNSTGRQPLFTDAWDRPILYYRATPAAPAMVSAGAAVGVYRQRDNGLITESIEQGAGVGHVTGLDFGPGRIPGAISNSTPVLHGISRIVAAPAIPVLVNGINAIHDSNNPTYINSFTRFIHDPTIAARNTPVNSKTYLLISAGNDARYGTTDDIVNWTRANN